MVQNMTHVYYIPTSKKLRYRHTSLASIVLKHSYGHQVFAKIIKKNKK